jgi:hypothetical protein
MMMMTMIKGIKRIRAGKRFNVFAITAHTTTVFTINVNAIFDVLAAAVLKEKRLLRGRERARKVKKLIEDICSIRVLI